MKMIYLDYSGTTPISLEALDTYNKVQIIILGIGSTTDEFIPHFFIHHNLSGRLNAGPTGLYVPSSRNAPRIQCQGLPIEVTMDIHHIAVGLGLAACTECEAGANEQGVASTGAVEVGIATFELQVPGVVGVTGLRR